MGGEKAPGQALRLAPQFLHPPSPLDSTYWKFTLSTWNLVSKIPEVRTRQRSRSCKSDKIRGQWVPLNSSRVHKKVPAGVFSAHLVARHVVGLLDHINLVQEAEGKEWHRVVTGQGQH